MRYLALVAALFLTACNTTGSGPLAVNGCETKAPYGVKESWVVRDQYGCILGVDPDPRIRSQIKRERGSNQSSD